jgi:hypothetical protein
MFLNLVFILNLILFILSTFVISSIESRFHFGKTIFQVAEEELLEYRNSDEVKERWFLQILNHFDPQMPNRWKQRYFTHSKYSDPNGPVFLEIGKLD